MDDRETELSRFRQQWKAEVTARQTRPAAPQPLSSSSATKPAFPSRRLSHPSAVAKEVPEEGREEEEKERQAQDEGDATLPEPGPPDSPTAARRTSVSMSMPSVPESALEHYERAVERETQGSLGESLSLYRKAFRVGHRVDWHCALRLLLGSTSAIALQGRRLIHRRWTQR